MLYNRYLELWEEGPIEYYLRSGGVIKCIDLKSKVIRQVGLPWYGAPEAVLLRGSSPYIAPSRKRRRGPNILTLQAISNRLTNAARSAIMRTET